MSTPKVTEEDFISREKLEEDIADPEVRVLVEAICRVPVELHGIKWSSKSRCTTVKHDHVRIANLIERFLERRTASVRPAPPTQEKPNER